jgi:tripartite-type tricarboxylate transporter receptor subunit TctC
LVAAFRAATREPAFAARMKEMGEVPSGEGPEELRQRMTREYVAFGAVARRIGMSP